MRLTYKAISKLAVGLRDGAYDLETEFKPSVAYKISNNIENLLLANVPISKELKAEFDDHSVEDDVYFAYEEYTTSHFAEVDIQTFSTDELGDSVSLAMMELLRIMIEEPTE